MKILLMILLGVTALFMIMLVLIQRGRGGGLVGALGGMGGQSAFGTKAGDLFTRVTMWSALFWIILAIGTVKYLSTASGDGFSDDFGKQRPNPQQSVESGAATGAANGTNSGDDSKSEK
ncbi:MAG: preprotein translocase subunit SecG [Pirellulales bacterium]